MWGSGGSWFGGDPAGEVSEKSSRAIPASSSKGPSHLSRSEYDMVREKVDDYIQEHFYTMQASVSDLRKQMDEISSMGQRQQHKVEEMLQQMRALIQMQTTEVRKGKGRDAEIETMAEELNQFREVLSPHGNQVQELTKMVDKLHESNDGTEMHSAVKDELTKRDELIYKIEAEIGYIKSSFTSLRLEVQKHQRSIDYKNVQEYIKLMKAMDEKPEERKHILRSLHSQEDKLKASLGRTELDIRSLEEALKSNHEASQKSAKRGARHGGDPLDLVQDNSDPKPTSKLGVGFTKV